MLLNSVIFILREVLEASLIISVLLALSQNQGISKKWLIPAVISGLALAGLYANQLTVISSYFDGVGQEVVNAGLHLLIYSFILLTIVLLKYPATKPLSVLTMMGCVVFASIREGSEIIIYLAGFMSLPDLFSSVMMGSIIGAGIGVSIGILFYYLIAYARLDVGLFLGLLLLVLIAGGMVSQTIQLLMQADFISSQAALWDSSFLIDERSLFGQLLYALIGYESTPTLIQFICYSLSILLAGLLTVSTFRSSSLLAKT
jgi:high-affinity iron transporter